MEEIESEIQQTRSRVDDTIGAIQDKLSPGQLVEQAMDYFRHGGSADFVANLGTAIKQNPLPVTLLGIGLGWLMLSGSNQKASNWQRDDASDYGYDLGPSAYGTNRAMQSSDLGNDSSASAGILGKAGAVKDKAKHAAEDALHKVGDIAHSARNKMDATKTGAYDSLDRASYQIDQTKHQLLSFIDEQPWVIGAVGIAIGAALGAGLPATRKEDEWMGKTRDEVVDKATELGHEQVEKAKSTLRAAKDTALEEADKEGLTADAAKDGIQETLEKAQRVVEVAAGSAKREADKQGLTPN